MRLPLFVVVLLTSTLPVAQGADDYKPCPDSTPQLGVSQGMMLSGKCMSHTIFPGTGREVSIHLPAALVSFQERGCGQQAPVKSAAPKP